MLSFFLPVMFSYLGARYELWFCQESMRNQEKKSRAYLRE